MTYPMIFGCARSYPLCIVGSRPPGQSCAAKGGAMASPWIDYCEQANPRVLAEIRRLGSAFRNARRLQVSFVAASEKQALLWMAERTPAWINSDHLPALGL